MKWAKYLDKKLQDILRALRLNHIDVYKGLHTKFLNKVHKIRSMWRNIFTFFSNEHIAHHHSSTHSNTGNIFNLKDSKFVSDIFRLQLFYPFDEVCFFEATVARLVPLVQDLLQVADFQLLQIDRLDINGFVCKNISFLKTA